MSGVENRGRRVRRRGATAAPGRTGRRWWEIAPLAVAVIGVLVAVGAWLLPRDPDPSEPTSGPTAASTTPGPSGTGRAPDPTSPPDPSVTAGGVRYLTELTPTAGAGFVQRVGAHSLFMRCGSGESDDPYREVTYDVPPTGYRSFATVARPTGQRDTRVQVTLLLGGSVEADPVLVAGSSGPIGADPDDRQQLTLRVTCDAGATSVTFTDPRVTR